MFFVAPANTVELVAKSVGAKKNVGGDTKSTECNRPICRDGRVRRITKHVKVNDPLGDREACWFHLSSQSKGLLTCYSHFVPLLPNYWPEVSGFERAR
jgi:hypothetical protein